MSADTGQTRHSSSDATGTLFDGYSRHAGLAEAEQIVFTLSAPVDHDAFTGAWRELIARHGILRNAFRDELEVRQASSTDFTVASLDLRDAVGDARAVRFNDYRMAEMRRRFDLDTPPLFRVTLVDWDENTVRVIWTLRRALLDWRSMSTLLRELFANYRLTRDGNPGSAPAALVSGYPGWAGYEAGNTDAAFWREFFTEFNSPTRVDLQRMADGTADYLCAERSLDASQSDAIRRLAKAAGVTLNNVTQAAWALLLSHYARSNDVAFGIVRSCRRNGPPGLEDAVGSFMNIVPLRAAMPTGSNVFELLWQLRDQHRRVRVHECSCLADIERAAGISGKLFDTVLEFDLRDPMAALDELLIDEGARQFTHEAPPLAGLHLQVYDEATIRLRLKCMPGFTDNATLIRMLDHFVNLLTGMAREPWLPVRDIPCLNIEDTVPCRWPDAAHHVTPDLPGTLVERFEQVAAAHPEDIAVACGSRSMTYAELDAAANRLAHILQRDDIVDGTLVGLCTARSIEQVIGILGILKAGAGYLPLDPAYPTERLQFLLQDAHVTGIVASTDVRTALPEGAYTFIEPFIAPGDAPDTTPHSHTRPESLAYVIYTSGSTGQPKGVMVSHRNVVRLFDACASWLNPGENDVWTMFHSFAFDFSVWEIWGALLYGGRLEIVPHDVARSPDTFAALLADRGVTVLSQTPSAFRELMRVDAETHPDLSALRMVVFGGEKLDLESLAGWMERHGEDTPQLINMYGITETTVHVTCRRILQTDVDNHRGSLIGWPLADLYVRLLDKDGRIVPPGVRGEICVGGAGVTGGYLNRPQLTAQRFTTDPHSSDEGSRLYRSGDFARRMPNGELCYLGREDDEVKIRGFRIDLGEITHALKRIPGVESAVVVPRETSDGDRRLIAYYVVVNGASLSERGLREQLAASLPEHMLPAILVPLAALPVNANNKIDFKALPDPSTTRNDSHAAVQPPTSPLETLLVRLWQEVLERTDIGRNEDFFALGGDSILALKLVARARAAGLELMPRDVFNHPVLADLARQVKAISTQQEEADVNMDGPWALTPIQRWFFDQGFENPDHWNEAFLFRLPPDTDIDLLERAMLDVVEHHAALRARYLRADNGKWVAEPVEAAEALEFSRIELDHLDEDERREAVSLITEEIQASLSIASGLLVRAAHFSGGLEDGARLLIVIHQLAIDAASWPIILQDLETACRARVKGREPRAPRGSISYAGWAAHLERQARSPLIGSEHAYWEQVMRAGADAALADIVDPGFERDAVGVSVSLETPDTAALLGDVHHAYGTEVNELLIAGLAQVCREQWREAPTLRIDLQRHGRNDEFGNIDVSRTVGWFSVLHPVALNLAVARNPARLICDVKSRIRSAPHQGAGWGMLRYLGRAGASLFGRAQAQRAPILFNYRGQFERALSSSMFQHVAEDAGPTRGGDNRLTHPLTVTAAIHDDRMQFEFRFSNAVLDEQEVRSLAARYVDALKDIVSHCLSREGVARAPVDFPFARLSQEELDDFPIPLENVEEILPLSPIQRLYHALSGTDKDVGFDQWVFRLQGRIDEPAFEAAWQELFRRHDALRTVFVDRGLAEPHQVVLREVEFRLQRTDWRLLDDTLQQQRLKEFLNADRRQGFETNVAPLTRVTLIRARDDRWILVWSHHQALVDGWSWPILAQELGQLHDTRIAGRIAELETPGSYRSYIAWLLNRDVSEYARFWREHLGVGRPARTLITRSRRRDDGKAGKREFDRLAVELPEDTAVAVMQLARQLRLTPGVVFQAAWALLLSALTRRFDVTLGVAFSGRTAGVADAANTVGPFLNDLPVHVRVSPTERVDEWLASLRGLQADINHYQNVSPLEVHEWSGNPPGIRLFDALVVFQNYATGDATRRWGDNIKVLEFEAGVRTNYPLSVAVTPGRPYRIEFFHDSSVIDADAVTALSKDLVAILGAMAKSPDVRISTILNHVSGGEPVAEVDAKPVNGRWRRRAGDTDSDAVAVSDDSAVTGFETTSDIAKVVSTTCREVLGIEDFDVHRNFFDVGAQSVALIEIHQRLRRKLHRSFPIVKLFQHPTIAALSHYLEYGEPGEAGDRLRDAGRRGAARRAALQQRRRPLPQPGGSES